MDGLPFEMETALFGNERQRTGGVAGDPVAELFETLEHEAYLEKCADTTWLAPIGDDKNQADEVRKRSPKIPSKPSRVPAQHPDGIFTERDSDGTWELTYKDGKLVRQIARHADGTVQYFDHDGVEVEALPL